YLGPFSADERLLAGWIETDDPKDQTKRAFAVWEVATGRQLFRTSGVDGVFGALSPDGRTAALIDFHGLHVWNLITGKKLKTYPSYDRLRGRGFGFASSLAFSPDGRTIVTGHPDGTILLWEAPQPATAVNPSADDWADLAAADPATAFAAVCRLS